MSEDSSSAPPLKRLGKQAVPALLLTSAVAVAATLSGCSSTETRQRTVQCVKKVDPTAGDDDVEVEVVDSRNCDSDGAYRRAYGGGGNYFLSSGGYYAAGALGQRYLHSSSSNGGGGLVGATDTAARSRISAPSSFKNGSVSGPDVSVRSGGLGGGTSKSGGG